MEASYGLIAVLQDALTSLAAYYPTGHFDTENPRDYISELIATRFRWHRYRHEPHGHGQDGSMVHALVAGSVVADVEQMIVEMVGTLTVDWSSSTDSDFITWKAQWDRSNQPLPSIDVQVSDGKSVVVTAINRGRPFTLVMRGRLAKSNGPIDHSYPYEYIPRKVSSGDVIKNYTISDVDDHRVVTLYGEAMAIMQTWRPTWRDKVEFEVVLTFLSKDDGHTHTIGEYAVSVVLETGTDRLKADLVGAQKS